MIRFKFVPTFEDYWAFNRRILFRSSRKLIWIAGLLMALFVIMPFMATPGQNKGVIDIYLGGSPLLILPAILAWMFYATYRGAKKRWELAEELRSEVEFEIGPEGVQVRREGGNGYLEWRNFVSAELTKGWFTLTTAQKSRHFFPESAVPDSAALRELLKEKIADARV